MGRIGTRAQEHHPGRLLGMQRNRLAAAPGLLRALSARFGRCLERALSAADLSAQSLLHLHAPDAETSRQPATPAGSGLSPPMIEPDDIIYLDNNATTRIDPLVLEEMLPFLTHYYGNPSSGYRFGVQVRNAVDLARERVAALVGCTPGEIVFTGCGTEASNTAIVTALQVAGKQQHVVITDSKHRL